MPKDYEEVERELLEVSNVLGLLCEEQDWGIVNADGDRLEEFICFYTAHREYSASLQYQLFELIMASANERLCDHGTLGEEFADCVSSNKTLFGSQIDYWKSLDDVEQFPLGEYLRKYSARGG